GPVSPVTVTTPPPAVPEHTSLLLGGLGALGLCGIVYRRRPVRSRMEENSPQLRGTPPRSSVESLLTVF
ncbi:MAG: hypothetical protein ACK5UC_05960, partial [Planctomycetaceae bacterium]